MLHLHRIIGTEGPLDARTLTIRVQCIECKETHHIKMLEGQYLKWREGTVLQKAAPSLTVNERELLISATCEPCFDKLSGGADFEDEIT